jgi:hypothetical protein
MLKYEKIEIIFKRVNVYLPPIGLVIWSSIVSNEESCWRKLPHTWQTNCGKGDLGGKIFVDILSKTIYYVSSFYSVNAVVIIQK